MEGNFLKHYIAKFRVFYKKRLIDLKNIDVYVRL